MLGSKDASRVGLGIFYFLLVAKVGADRKTEGDLNRDEARMKEVSIGGQFQTALCSCWIFSLNLGRQL